MALNRFFFFLSFPILFFSSGILAEENIDYKKIFSEDNDKAFSDWAKPQSFTAYSDKKCSENIKARITDPTHKVIFCEHIASISDSEQSKKGQLIYSIREVSKLGSDYDCDSGVIYLNNEKTITESSPVGCADILNIASPSDRPLKIFRIKRTGNIGMVLSNHGLECANHWVVLQENENLKRVHLLASRCAR